MRMKNILAENMHRFGTKNLNEDGDQNNNGYPDRSESSKSTYYGNKPYEPWESRDMKAAASIYLKLRNQLNNASESKNIPDEDRSFFISLANEMLSKFKKLSTEYESKFNASIGFYP